MKNLSFLLLFSILSFAASAQWVLQNPYPTDKDLKSVVFPDANTGYAVGSNGTILKTTDGGITWNLLTSGTSVDLNDLFFFDSMNGYVVGGGWHDGIILKTNDGGASWLNLFTSQEKIFTSVTFTNDSTGYVVGGGDIYQGNGGIILKTVDKGLNWDTLSSGTDIMLNSIFFTNANIGYIVGGNESNLEGIILKTSDGGSSWSVVLSGLSYLLRDVCFTDGSIGYAIGKHWDHGEIILKTCDGGISWTTANFNIYNTWQNELFSIEFVNDSTGYVVGKGVYHNCRVPIILKTCDSGVTWEEILDPFTFLIRGIGFHSICFIPGNNNINACCAVGERGSIFNSIDGCTTWTNGSSVTSSYLNSVFFTDDYIGYAAGGILGWCESNILLKTINGGNNWTVQQLPPGIDLPLDAVYFPSAEIGYVVGMNSTILKTMNGGITWNSIQNPPQNSWFRSVYFTDINTGFVTGGNIYKTNDGGYTWITSWHNTTNLALISIYFVNSDIGYSVGDIILKTVDGGLNWTQLSSNIPDLTLRSVYFIDANNGYAVGYQSISFNLHRGIILKTNDGGLTWITTSSSGSDWPELYSVYFPDPEHGYAVGGNSFYGGNGIILKTSDGGETWSIQSSYPDRELRSVFFNNYNTGYAVGSHGTILMTPNGGGYVGQHEAPAKQLTLKAFPNPFIDQSSIEYVLGQGAIVNLSVFNLLGQLVGTLVNEFQDRGTHRVILNASSLPVGIYYCRLQACNHLESTKIIKIQ